MPHAQTPTWRTGVSLLVGVITFDLSGPSLLTSQDEAPTLHQSGNTFDEEETKALLTYVFGILVCPSVFAGLFVLLYYFPYSCRFISL